MKTKTILLSAIAAMAISAASAQTQSGQKEMVRINVIQEKDGKTIRIDTLMPLENVHQLKDLGIEIPDLPKPPHAPGHHRLMHDSVFTISHAAHFTGDSMLFRELHKDLSAEDMKKLREELHVMLKEKCDSAKHKVMIIRHDGKRCGDSNVVFTKKMHFMISKLEITEPSSTERKALTGTDENTLNVTEVNAYPNPNNGKFNLTFTLKEKGNTTISVYNAEGKRVYNETLTDFSGKYEGSIDLTGSPEGIYFLNVQQGKGKNLVKKIVIK